MLGHKFKHWREVPEGFWPKNFHPTTDPMLVSPDTGEIYFDVQSFQALQRLRDIVGPIRILSGYRSKVYNARVGGAPRSEHSTRIAFDIQIEPYNVQDLVESAVSVGFSGIGYYPSRGFIHLDLGRPRTWYGSQRDKRLMQQQTVNIEL